MGQALALDATKLHHLWQGCGEAELLQDGVEASQVQVQVRTLSRCNETYAELTDLWPRFRKNPEWLVSPETTGELTSSFPQVSRWSMELRPQKTTSFYSDYQLEVLVGSRLDGRSTFSTRPDLMPETCTPPQLRRAGEGGFEVLLYPLFANEAFRGVIYELTSGALEEGHGSDPLALCDGQDCEFALAGCCGRGGGIVGDLRLQVKWAQAGTVCRAPLRFRRDASCEELKDPDC